MCAQAIYHDLDWNNACGREEKPITELVISITISLKNDNQGSIVWAHNPVFHARTKNIDIQHNYIRDEVAAQKIKLLYVPTSKMIADGFTKALTYVKFHGFITQIKMT